MGKRALLEITLRQRLGRNGGTEQQMVKVINQIYWLQTQQNCTLRFTVVDINNTLLLLQKPS